MAVLKKEKLCDMSVEGYEHVKQRLLSLAIRKDGCSLLDIGCHHGTFTVELGRSVGAKKLYGIDIADKWIREARRRGVVVKKVDLDKNRFPFRKKIFDVILCNQVIEHLTNPDKLLEEIHRTLKDDGYALISTPNLASLHNRLFLFFGSQPTILAPSTKIIFGNPLRGVESGMYGPARHVTAFTYKSFKEMLNHYNFKIDRYSGSGFYPLKGICAEILAKLFPNLAVYSIARVSKKI